MFATAVMAQEDKIDQRYVADIELQTAAELQQLLDRAEQLILAGPALPRGEAKVTFVLHGPVLENLLRQNYLHNKSLVDKAAALSAMDVIDVKACQTWMRSHSLNEQELQPFIETVVYAPAAVKELLKSDKYIDF